jgi:hypothetical protein
MKECPRCHRHVEWNAREWNGQEQACLQCAPLPPNPREVLQQKATPVVVTGVDVPVGDLAMLLFKLVFASVPIGFLLALIWLFIQMKSV